MSLTPLQEKNKVIIAVAGSGKTTSLVRKAIANSSEKRILFLTYTTENLNNIRKTFIKEAGAIPANVEIISWFSFLLRDGVRPYHNSVSGGDRVTSICFIHGSSAAINSLRYVRETNTERYYFDRDRKIYTDKISKYVCKCNEETSGLVINRLEKIYSSVYIDEIQDLAGWDLEFLKLLMHSQVSTVFVGDPRQVTYSTNHARKNDRYKDEKIVDFFTELAETGVCEIITQDACVRCNQAICDLANEIYPEFPKAVSGNSMEEGRDGVFIISAEQVPAYIEEHDPVILRYKKDSNTLGYAGINYGASKGLTFNRVLIFPTEKIKKFLTTKDVSHAGDRAKFYVAVTRARHSVAFVIN